MQFTSRILRWSPQFLENGVSGNFISGDTNLLKTRLHGHFGTSGLAVIRPRRNLRVLIVSRRALDFRVDHCSDKQR